jgi:hypothetical protein
MSPTPRPPYISAFPKKMSLRLPLRAVVFTLASLSFVCLLGQFFGLWSMHLFGCWVLPPATALLALIAWRARGKAAGIGSAHTWIVQGAFGGVLAAVAYDLYRLPFVLGGAPLFTVFPRFGQLLLGANEPAWLVQMLGWSYHFSNGAALGIMFLALVVTASRRVLFWGAVTWALFVEAMLLLTPYAGFFGLPLNARFLFLTASAHLVFGLVLGAWCKARLGVEKIPVA